MAGKALRAALYGSPINSTAANVVKQANDKPARPIAKQIPHWEAPPEGMQKAPPHLLNKRTGRLIVIGKAKRTHHSPGKTARYVVRCDCSRYEVRSEKALRNPLNIDDCCHECRRLIETKRLVERRKAGYVNPPLGDQRKKPSESEK